jgi:succinate dehydrogenase/fumarate reductase flavoprotein subunit
MLPVEKIATDILVVGGGAAGLTAALEARSLGRDVTILSKSKVGRSGNTIVSGTGMAMLTKDPEAEDSPEIYGRDTLKSGKDVNDGPMMKIFLKGSTDIIETLTRYGVVLRKLDGRFMKKRVPGHSMPRSLTTDFGRYPYLSRGLSLSEPLLRSAEKSGIRIIDFAPVIRLLTADGAICGAVAIGKKEEKTLVFSAPTIILAAGGGGRIYSRSNNTFDMTGDAYALACEAGATLRDMEFVQFYPTMMFSPIKVTVSSPLFGEGAFLRNSLGERFMERYDPAGDMATRDIMTRAMFNEVIEGRGRNGDIFMDCRHLSRDVLTRKYPGAAPSAFQSESGSVQGSAPDFPGDPFFHGRRGDRSGVPNVGAGSSGMRRSGGRTPWRQSIGWECLVRSLRFRHNRRAPCRSDRGRQEKNAASRHRRNRALSGWGRFASRTEREAPGNDLEVSVDHPGPTLR